jgi:FkbM family methyltransferase
VTEASPFTLAKHALARRLHKRAPRLHYEIMLLRRDRHIEPELWMTQYLCTRDRAAIDVGANEGLFSLYLAKHARRVYALEPNPLCVARLRRLLPRRVELLSVAASDHAGTADLRFDPQNTGIGTVEVANDLQLNPGIGSIDRTPVALARLDDLVSEPVSFIKIDVEGHEEAVLRGATGLIARDRPSFLIEVEERHNSGAVERVSAFMARRGYRGFYLRDAHLHRLESFDHAMQDVAALLAGEAYINNFFFVHASVLPGLPARWRLCAQA